MDVFFLPNYIALSFIWLYMIACMHIRIASIFYNIKCFIFMKGAYVCLVLFFFFWSLLFQTSVEPLQLFYVWCSHGIIFFSFLDFQYLWIFVENASLYTCILVWFYYQNIIRRLTSKDKIIMYFHKKNSQCIIASQVKMLIFFPSSKSLYFWGINWN